MRDGIPRDRSLDSTIALLREGYRFIPSRCRRLRSDIFVARLMGEKAIWISGRDAAEVFYDPVLFQRGGAVPRRIRRTLFGDGGVQTLDDAAHRHRKAMFMSLMTPASVAALTDLTTHYWRNALPRWTGAASLVLFSEAQDILCRAACAWAGVPLGGAEVRRRASQFGAMVDAFGGLGPRHWRGRLARRSLERWLEDLVIQVRSGDLKPASGSALAVVVSHRDLDGALLGPRLAAVELMNLLRPTVAIATYITFAALALHHHPRCRALIRDGDDDHLELFVHEVRRFYPFAPFIGARVRDDFVWRGHPLRKGTLVVLDIYGTNHDPRRWDRADEFLPERFKHWSGDPFDFIPQGGGDHHTGHRCAGERVTIEVLKAAARFLTRHVDYDVPAQDLGFSLDRIPTLPRSGFVIRRVRADVRELGAPHGPTAADSDMSLQTCTFSQR